MIKLNAIENASVAAYIKVSEAIRRFKLNEKGVTAVEYAIVIAGVAGIVAIIFGKDGTVQTMLTGIFDSIEENVTNNLPTGSGSGTPSP